MPKKIEKLVVCRNHRSKAHDPSKLIIISLFYRYVSSLNTQSIEFPKKIVPSANTEILFCLRKCMKSMVNKNGSLWKQRTPPFGYGVTFSYHTKSRLFFVDFDRPYRRSHIYIRWRYIPFTLFYGIWKPYL